MTNFPSTDQMAEELVASGWVKVRIGMWKSPGGALYFGPFQAWKAMNGILEKEGIFGDARGRS